jgi:hypothetical protein
MRDQNDWDNADGFGKTIGPIDCSHSAFSHAGVIEFGRARPFDQWSKMATTVVFWESRHALATERGDT